MPARRKLSIRQMELLVEFAEGHRDIALGRFAGGPLASQAARQAWQNLALQLNAVADGATKTADQWRRYWIELKAKIRNKAADSRRNATATGGGPNKLIPLSDLEQRVLALVGPVAVEGLHGVRVPVNITSDEPPISTTSSFSPPPNLSLLSTAQEILSPLEAQTEIIPLPAAGHQEEQQPLRDHTYIAQSVTEPIVSREVIQQSSQNLQPPAPSSQRPRSHRQLRRDERVPRWAYDLETRRISAEERLASAIEALVQLMHNIRDEIRVFTGQTN